MDEKKDKRGGGLLRAIRFEGCKAGFIGNGGSGTVVGAKGSGDPIAFVAANQQERSHASDSAASSGWAAFSHESAIPIIPVLHAFKY